MRLLRDVRQAQARALWTQGVLWAVVVVLVALGVTGLIGERSPLFGTAALWFGGLVAVGLVALFTVVLPRKRVGDDARTAKLLGAQLPGLNLDLLAAVELSRALGRAEDFSPDLARAFLRDVDARAARLSVSTLVDGRPSRRAALALVATVFTLLGLLVVRGGAMRAGLARVLLPTPAGEPLRRTPITGDVELTYRYPAHTGLEPRTLPSTTGDVSAPTGTEVTYRTRADRDLDGAVLVMGADAKRVPLRVEHRELSGTFVVTESGPFHVAFVEGSKLVAEGPDQSITAEADQTPQARITAPLDGLEIDPQHQAVTLQFDASDDYGLSALDLVFTPDGADAKRVTLKPDDGRTTRGTYQWDLQGLALKPGQTVSYLLEATDNDAVSGPKKGVSTTLHLKLYSASEHRREALAQAEALWGRLIDHLADRMESADRPSPSSIDAALANRPIDERGAQLATDFSALVGTLQDEKEPPPELLGALRNIANELARDVGQVASSRQVLLRLSGRVAPPPGAKAKMLDAKNGPYVLELQRRLSSSIEVDLKHSEKNVLYLESLLDMARLDAIRELAKQLRQDRQELSRVLEEFKNAPDSATQQALLDKMNALKQRMLELQQRMSELSKSVRDDFMNAEALEQLQNDFDLNQSLEDVESLVKAGKADEALKKMQELAMQMDELLENIEQAGEDANEQMDPELARQFSEFQENLEQTISKQEQLSEKTRTLRDKYRQQQRERIARQGEALKRELKQRLDELEKSWSEVDPDRFGLRFEELLKEANQARSNVEQSLEANDFDLASEAADQLEDKARQMSGQAAEQRMREEQFQNPPEMRRESRQAADKLAKDARKAEEVAQKLRELFPQPGQQMSDSDRQQMGEMARQQKQLEQQTQQLQQQMENLGERAPIFDEEATQQMEQAGQRMQGASERLGGKDSSRGYGEQQGALQALRGIQQGLEQSGNGSGKKGIPLPMKGRGRGRGTQNEKIAIPDEDPNAAPRELRKDVMDAMKQGAPDRYRDQNKRYYEELVK